MRSRGVKVIMLGLIARFYYFEPKRVCVNYLLKDMSQEEGTTLIDNSNINPAKHLDSSKLHINRAGDYIFADNLFRACWNWISVQNPKNNSEPHEQSTFDEVANVTNATMEGNDASSQLKDIEKKFQRVLIVAYLNIN